MKAARMKQFWAILWGFMVRLGRNRLADEWYRRNEGKQ